MITRVNRDEELETLAVQAEAVADGLHRMIGELRDLADRMLSLELIDDMGGDRGYNWSLQSDLAGAQGFVYSTSVKARQVSRHARYGKTDQ
jgi:hypothetical protein